MGDLLEQIEVAAVDDSTPISTLLRKCAILADRLDHDEFRTWVDRELEGYGVAAVSRFDGLPSYRILPAPAFGHLAGPMGSGYKNIPIPSALLPEKVRDFAERVAFRQSIAEIEALSQSKDGILCPWSGDLMAIAQDKLFKSHALYGAWQPISRAQLRGVIDTVRNRVLKFALQLKRTQPNAGQADVTPPSPAQAAAVTHLFQQTVIHGDVIGNVATGSHAVQTAGDIKVMKSDLESLKAWLAAVGVSKDDISEVVTAVAVDPPTGETFDNKPKTSAWLVKMMQKASSGAMTLGTGVTVDLIVKAIAAYYGFAG
jgi:hypothetical protein